MYDTTCLHVPFFHTCPCFATLRHSFLGISPHPLANCLAPNPNGRCSPLSFGSLVLSICSPLYVPSLFKALPFLHFMFFFQTFSCVSSFSQRFPQFSLGFPSLPFIFSSIFMVFATFSSIFPHFLQPFATPSSVSLLIPLQTVLLRTPTDAALRWASDP